VYLADADPEIGLLDVGGGFVVAAQESHRRGCVLGLGGFVQVGEKGVDVGRTRDVGRVGGGADDEKMIAEGVVVRGQCDALLDSYPLRCRAVRDGDVY
jgi:hypothetical protein